MPCRYILFGNDDSRNGFGEPLGASNHLPDLMAMASPSGLGALRPVQIKGENYINARIFDTETGAVIAIWFKGETWSGSHLQYELAVPREFRLPQNAGQTHVMDAYCSAA